MIKLDKIGIGNALPLPQNTRIIVATDYNKVVDKINEIIDTIVYIAGLTPDYTIYTDPSTGFEFRAGIRDSVFVVDKALNATGFDGTEGIDWENIFITE